MRFRRENGIFAKLDNENERRLVAVGGFVSTAAKLNAPVDTGTLRSSIYHEIVKEGSAVRIGASVEYAIFQEFGTRYMAAQPFLLPAVLDNKHIIMSILGGK